VQGILNIAAGASLLLAVGSGVTIKGLEQLDTSSGATASVGVASESATDLDTNIDHSDVSANLDEEANAAASATANGTAIDAPSASLDVAGTGGVPAQAASDAKIGESDVVAHAASSNETSSAVQASSSVDASEPDASVNSSVDVSTALNSHVQVQRPEATLTQSGTAGAAGTARLAVR
jgi:hypothetical protein